MEVGQSAGKSIRDAKKRVVVVTLDGGIEDVDYERQHGRRALAWDAVVMDHRRGGSIKEWSSAKKTWAVWEGSRCGR